MGRPRAGAATRCPPQFENIPGGVTQPTRDRGRERAASAHSRAAVAPPLADSDLSVRLSVDGELSDRVGGAFAGLTLTRDGGTTVLAGRVRDQAELQGIMQRISDLGLTLLSATAVDPRAEGRE